MSDKNLITVFTKWRSRFLRQAMRMLPSEQDAEDVLQDAFIRLWQKADMVNTDEEATALATVTIRHLAIDRFREGQHRHTVEINGQMPEPTDNEDDTANQEERRTLVETIMRRVLTPLQQRIIQFREYEGRSYEEVADLLGMNQPAVRVQLSRARKAIRDEYKRINMKP